jgi:hypothetical protein
MFIFILLLLLKTKTGDCDYYDKNKARSENVKKAFPVKKVT